MGQELFVLHLAAALTLTGLIWFVQVVHYPLFAKVGEPTFAAYESTHTRLTTFVVAPVMLLEASTAFALFWNRPEYLEFRDLCIASALLLAIWTSTLVWQVPQHRRLADGFKTAVHRRLVRGNWFRTIAWSLRAMILLVALMSANAASNWEARASYEGEATSVGTTRSGDVCGGL